MVNVVLPEGPIVLTYYGHSASKLVVMEISYGLNSFNLYQKTMFWPVARISAHVSCRT